MRELIDDIRWWLYKTNGRLHATEDDLRHNQSLYIRLVKMDPNGTDLFLERYRIALILKYDELKALI